MEGVSMGFSVTAAIMSAPPIEASIFNEEQLKEIVELMVQRTGLSPELVGSDIKVQPVIKPVRKLIW